MRPLLPGSKLAVVLRALRRPGGLTTASAFGIGDCHLPGTVFQLKRAGYHVTSEWKTGATRFGSICRFKKYRVITTQK